jgi:hypothetical protein
MKKLHVSLNFMFHLTRPWSFFTIYILSYLIECRIDNVIRKTNLVN